jgi:hypothetical protein
LDFQSDEAWNTKIETRNLRAHEVPALAQKSGELNIMFWKKGSINREVSDLNNAAEIIIKHIADDGFEFVHLYAAALSKTAQEAEDHFRANKRELLNGNKLSQKQLKDSSDTLMESSMELIKHKNQTLSDEARIILHCKSRAESLLSLIHKAKYILSRHTSHDRELKNTLRFLAHLANLLLDADEGEPGIERKRAELKVLDFCRYGWNIYSQDPLEREAHQGDKGDSCQ